MADKGLNTPELDRREHDDGLLPPTKRVFAYGFDGADKQPLSTDSDGHMQVDILSGAVGNATVNVAGAATIYAVVNTGASNSNVTLNPSPNYIGLVTIANTVPVSSSDLDIRDLTSVSDSVSAVQSGDWNVKSLLSTATIYAVVNTGSSNSNVTLNPSPNQIGSVTVSHPVDAAQSGTWNVGTVTTITNTVSVDDDGTTLSIDDGDGSITTDWASGATVSVASIPDVTIGNAMVTVTLGTKLDATNDSVALGAGTNQIGSVSVSNSLDIRSLNSTATLYAVVNTGASNSNVTINPGPNQIGSVTVSNPVTIDTGGNWVGLATVWNANSTSQVTVFQGGAPWQSMATLYPRTDYIGLVSVSGKVDAVQSGTWNIATLTGITNDVNVADGGNSLTVDWPSGATVAVSHVPEVAINDGGNIITVDGTVTANLSATDNTVLDTIETNTDYGTVTGGGTETGALRVTLANNSTGVVSVDDNGGALTVDGTVAVTNAGLTELASAIDTEMQVDVVGSLPAGDNNIGNMDIVTMPEVNALATVNVSNVVNSVATVAHTNSGKTWFTKNIALNSTNLSGSTIFISASSKKYYVTSLVLSNASVVGLSVLNGATYLNGNASVRMQLAANSGLVDNGSVLGPVYTGLANQTNFLIATDTDAPISGKVVWFEE